MLAELFKDVADTVNSLRYGTATRTITVARPYCTPCRGFVMTALQPYGVKIHGFTENTKVASPLDVLGRKIPNAAFDYSRALPIAQVATITVSGEAAAWAEYLLMRGGKLYVIPPFINRNNQAWADKHGGHLPPAWKDGKPWIEASCKDGVQAWQQVKDAAQAPTDNQNRSKRSKVK